ncbi:MAG TPA: DegT/DnrJ/EryC1/StrS family aminotransferase [Candidatus Kapabacteria bacterium]|nr:DegT/DnrJ/EryC1/StrS family aminotransferase [Candidatus Kapabacteria bacterium]
MKVPLLDLTKQYNSIQNEVEDKMLEIARSQKCILGEEVEKFETNIAKYLECNYAIAVSSGTDALLMSLMALNIGPDDEVIVPDFTFFATAGCVARMFAKPVFVDIDPITFNIDSSKIEEKITNKTKAIMPVHLFGQSAEMDEIIRIAKKHSLAVIEDAAQALGTQYKDGKFVGTIGDFGCFSFYPSKNLGAFGDGGLIITNNQDIAAKLKQMRNHGMNPKYYHKFIGGNFRLDAIQAGILNVKLNFLDDWHQDRRDNAHLYVKYFQKFGLININNNNEFSQDNCIIYPKAIYSQSVAKNYHIYNQFTIRVKDRDELQKYLSNCDIGTDIYYPIPLHRQECFAYLNANDNEFPNTNRISREALSLPVFPELQDEQIQYVCECIRNFYKN